MFNSHDFYLRAPAATHARNRPGNPGKFNVSITKYGIIWSRKLKDGLNSSFSLKLTLFFVYQIQTMYFSAYLRGRGPGTNAFSVSESRRPLTESWNRPVLPDWGWTPSLLQPGHIPAECSTRTRRDRPGTPGCDTGNIPERLETGSYNPE